MARASWRVAVDDLLFQPVAKIPGRIDGDRVAGVDAGSLNVLHNTGDEDILPVADGVHLNLHTHQVLVNEHRVFNVHGQRMIFIYSLMSASEKAMIMFCPPST